SQPNSGMDYDSPEVNAEAHLFVPSVNVLKQIRVRVVDGGGKVVEEQPPMSPRDAFLRLMDLMAGEEQPQIFFEELGFDRATVEQLAGLINNVDRKPLDLYYQAVREEFTKREIVLSENFLRRYARLFVLGHLNAKDAVTTPNEELREKSVRLVIETLKR